MDIKIFVGKRVKQLRNKLGYSQEELADITTLPEHRQSFGKATSRQTIN